MNNKIQNKKNLITLKQLLWYFIFFSIFGLIIETIFCYATMGILESRKGLIWGPFCPVYGVGACIFIIMLNKYKDKPLHLFIIGSIIGNVTEYLLSFLLEAIYGMRFWDYSYLEWNLNGRICFKYSLFWGVLALILIKGIKGPIDKLINCIPNNKILNLSIFVFLIIDIIATVWAVSAYQERARFEYEKINIKNEQNIIQVVKNKIENTLFSNKIMLKTFPNLRYTDYNGNQHYIRDILKSD